MKKQLFTFILVISLFVSCSNTEENDSNVLIEGLKVPRTCNTQLSTLFTNNLVITPLETSDESLIGRIDKIKKFKGDYYICSSNRQVIHRFDSKGKFVSSLNSLGAGPEEYLQIEDFDVCEVNGEIEVWVSDNHNLKIFDAFTFSFKYTISFPYMIHKFKRIDNSRILLVTGMNENILTLTDEHGNIISEYLEKKIPFIMFRPVQFISYESNYIFQLGIANAYVMFDSDTNNFQEGVFSNKKDFLTKNELLDYFESFGTDFIRKANEGVYINSMVRNKDNIWLLINNNRKRYIVKSLKGEMVSSEITNSSFLSSFGVGESDDSLLLYAHSEEILECEDELFVEYMKEIQYSIDDNPYILEFF